MNNETNNVSVTSSKGLCHYSLYIINYIVHSTQMYTSNKDVIIVDVTNVYVL